MYIVTINYRGKTKLYLKGAFWGSKEDHADQFPTKEAAEEALYKARWFTAPKDMETAVIEEVA